MCHLQSANYANGERWSISDLSWHLYYESPFSPDSLSIYNINEKHALGTTLNASRVSHFTQRLRSQYPFLPSDIVPRMEKMLNTLHYGWCSHVMDLIKGDLQLIRDEQQKPTPNDHLITDIGRGIERLLDTIEIATRLDEYSKPFIWHGAELRGNSKEEKGGAWEEPLSCYRLALAQPEMSFDIEPEQNGLTSQTERLLIDGGSQKSSGGSNGSKRKNAGSVFHHIVPLNDLCATWQTFFDTLLRSYQNASFLVQENAETARGNLFCTHVPDIMRSTQYFLYDDRGKYYAEALEAHSVLFTHINYHSEIIINLVAFEGSPRWSDSDGMQDVMSTKIKEWMDALVDVLGGEEQSTRDMVFEFITKLSQFPMAFKYLAMYYMVGDSLFYSIEKRDRKDYFMWIMDVFTVTRYYCGLACCSEGVLKLMLRDIADGGKRLRKFRRLMAKTAAEDAARDAAFASTGVVAKASPGDKGGMFDDDDEEEEEVNMSAEEIMNRRDVVQQWTGFAEDRDRVLRGIHYASAPTTGVWTAFQSHFRYFHLTSYVLRWRWCTHVKRPGRFNLSRYRQIDRDLAFMRENCGHSPSMDSPTASLQNATATGGNLPASSTSAASGSGAMLSIANGSASGNASPSAATGSGNSKGDENSVVVKKSGAKKKKKKGGSGSSGVAALQKPLRLCPHDAPLRLLAADPHPDDFVPRKFSVGEKHTEYLTADLDRMLNTVNKQCGAVDIAMDLRAKLEFFPPQLQWVFLMHVSKNPFPDYANTLVNLWSGIPMPGTKEDRASLVLILMDWIIALYKLNSIWKEVLFESVDDVFGDQSMDKKDYKVDPNKTSFRPTSLSKDICSFPRLLIGTLRKPRDCMADKIRLEAGLCWGSGVVSDLQQKWIQGWWDVTHKICYGCRVASFLASQASASMDAQNDLKCLVEQLRLSDCADTLLSKPAYGSHVSVRLRGDNKPFNDPTKGSEEIEDMDADDRCTGGYANRIESSSLAYAIDAEMAEIFEDLMWAEVEDPAKIHCVMLFTDFLHRHWGTDPSVLLMLERAELKVFPLVLQFAMLQEISFAHSRLHQEAIVWIIRHAYMTSGLRELLKEPNSNEVTLDPSSVKRSEGNGDEQSLQGGPTSTTPTATVTSTKDFQLSLSSTSGRGGERQEVSTSGVEGGLLDMMNAMSTNFDDDDKPTTPEELSRICAITSECLMLFKMRYQDLHCLNRWKFTHPESVINGSIDALKENVETSISSITCLTEELALNPEKCFELPASEIERDGGQFDSFTAKDAEDIRNGVFAFDVTTASPPAVNDEDSSAVALSKDAISDSDKNSAMTKYDSSTGNEKSGDGLEDIATSAANGKVDWKDPAPDITGRRVRRFNARTILWFFTFSKSESVTSQLLDRMWLSAKR